MIILSIRKGGIVLETWWETGFGGYEFEVGYDPQRNFYGFTGWVRCIGGRMADGRWPEWHGGLVRYSIN